jgi:ATP-dependent Lon protease
LITDYIAAVLHELRSIDYSSLLKDYARFDSSLSERDHLAIRKTFSGFIKLLYPDGNFTLEEALEIIDFAAECRKRVKDQLYIIDETFCADKAYFEYIIVYYKEFKKKITQPHFWGWCLLVFSCVGFFVFLIRSFL